MDSLEEFNLIQNCQKGNLEDFIKLYYEYIKKIYNFVYYRVSHIETAENLTTQIFIKALSNISEFNIDLGIFSVWLYKIAKNIVINYNKNKKNISDHNKENEEEEEENNNEEEDKKEIITMKLWDKLSDKEISRIIHRSEEDCIVIFSQIINKMKENNLKEKFDDIVLEIINNRPYTECNDFFKNNLKEQLLNKIYSLKRENINKKINLSDNLPKESKILNMIKKINYILLGMVIGLTIFIAGLYYFISIGSVKITNKSVISSHTFDIIDENGVGY